MDDLFTVGALLCTWSPPKKPLLETMQEDQSCLLLMVLGAAGLGVYHVGRAV